MSKQASELALITLDNTKHWCAGAVLDYIADCHGDCDTIPVTSLLWNKLDHTGWTPNGTSQGIWAGETLIADNNTWTISIPSALAPGKYVIRHEAARLDEAYWDYGMEFYPNCINIDVEGTGTAKLSGGVVGTELYKIGGMYISRCKVRGV